MATQLDLNELTNVTTVSDGVSDGTGAFDKLMNTVNLYLDDQYKSGRLKGTDYANVLLGSIQTAMQQSLQYTLQSKLTAAQIDSTLKDIDVKERQTAVTEQKLADELLTTEKQRLVLDKDALLKEEQEKLTYTERVIKDKQAVDLGLDNVYNLAKNAKDADTAYVYTPYYEEVV